MPEDNDNQQPPFASELPPNLQNLANSLHSLQLKTTRRQSMYPSSKPPQEDSERSSDGSDKDKRSIQISAKETVYEGDTSVVIEQEVVIKEEVEDSTQIDTTTTKPAAVTLAVPKIVDTNRPVTPSDFSQGGPQTPAARSQPVINTPGVPPSSTTAQQQQIHRPGIFDNKEDEQEEEFRKELEKVRQANIALSVVLSSVKISQTNLDTVLGAVQNADKLLDMWVSILSQTQHTQALLSDSTYWNGLNDDLQRKAAEEERRTLMQERARRAREEEERERRRKEEEELRRQEEEERNRAEHEKRLKMQEEQQKRRLGGKVGTSRYRPIASSRPTASTRQRPAGSGATKRPTQKVSSNSASSVTATPASHKTSAIPTRTPRPHYPK